EGEAEQCANPVQPVGEGAAPCESQSVAVNAEVECLEKAGAAEHRGRVASAGRGVNEVARPVVLPGADHDVERAAVAGRPPDQASRRDFNGPPKWNPGRRCNSYRD